MTTRPTLKPLKGQMLSVCLERLPLERRHPRVPLRWIFVAGVIAYAVLVAATRS